MPSPAFDSLNDTPMQRRLRTLAPMPIGVVFIQWPGMTEEEIRGHFRTMKALGYTCLKGLMRCPGTSIAKLQHMALDEGIMPWWYDQGGWEEITPELLARLGLPRDMDIDAAMEAPEMIAHQTQILRDRIDRHEERRLRGEELGSGKPFLPADRDPNAVAGVNILTHGTDLSADEAPHFVAWLERNYADIAALQHAWNAHSSSFGAPASGWKTWDDVRREVLQVPKREFRHLRDILRFKADVKLARLRRAVDASLHADAHEPVRAGGEISIFLPHTALGIDMEGFAEVMADGGCFYPSMHPGWHLEEVGFELVRPTFMQASMCADWARNAWSAPIESSGGPQWWSGGGKVPFVPEVKALQPAFTFSEHTMDQLLCTYLAAGFRGFGLWCWNPRDSGWEAGEYALCDRNNEVTPRARRVGQFGKAMRRLRRELWEARKEPIVGLYQDWENDAMWAALATSGRDRYKDEPTKARIGAARAFLNANIPWEHVTGRQLAKGIGPRYPAIYLPAVLSLSAEMLAVLTEYVRNGGRLVMDMPGAHLDERGHVIDTRPGSPFEQLFGVVLHEYGYANNVAFRIGDLALEGFTAVMTPTTARVTHPYASGGAAITENALGAGTAVLLGAEAAMRCHRPGNHGMEALLVENAIGPHRPPFVCEGVMAHRRTAPAADHYFLINDGPARTVHLDTGGLRYVGAEEAVTSRPVDLMEIPVDADGATWIRCRKAG